MHDNIKVGAIEFVAMERYVMGALVPGWALPGRRFTDSLEVAIAEAERLNESVREYHNAQRKHG